MEDTPTWHFPEVIDGRIIQDPVESEFFTTDSVGGLPQALVRETIQNSLDAKVSGCVHIRFAFLDGETAISEERLKQYFDGLYPHLEAPDNGLTDMPETCYPMSFLVIEDFGTRGLEGDPYKARPDKSDPGGEHFFYFWRNVGRSGKSGVDRGRWGLGKTVFPASSLINTFWGLTQRLSDKREFLMGLSVLKTHEVDQEFYTPYGHFGHRGTEDGRVDFSEPVKDDELINEFRYTFGLSRRDPPIDPGLSIVIPLPNSTITRDSIAKAIIRQYYYPILTGDLEIAIRDADGEFGLDMNSSNLESALESLDDDNENNGFSKEASARLIRFTRWATMLPDDEYITLKHPDMNKAPNWNYDFLDEEEIVDLRSAFGFGEPLAFNVPVKVEKKGGEPVLAWFRVFIERDEELPDAESHYIRDGITVTGIAKKRSGQRGIRGMVVIEGGPLSTMLGDAENPAHTEWQTDSRGFKEKYQHATSCLTFVKQSLAKLTRILTETRKDLDEDLLSDIFYVDVEDNTQIGMDKKPTRKRGRKTSGQRPEVPPRAPALVISSIEGGLRIRPNPASEIDVALLRIKLAYDVRNGNPFKQYDARDFDLANPDIRIVPTGVDIRRQEKNRLDAVVVDEDFELVIAGFDIWRDLKIDAKWEEWRND